MAELRGLLYLSLTELADIYALTSVDDGGGGATVTWGTAGTAIPCRVDPLLTGAEGFAGGRVADRSTHLVTMPPGTPVAAPNRVAVQGRGTFEVTAVRDRTGEKARLVEVVAT